MKTCANGSLLSSRRLSTPQVFAEHRRAHKLYTSLSGKGSHYPYPNSKFLAGEDSDILLTLKRGEAMVVEINSLKNTVLDRREYEWQLKSKM